MFIFVFVVLVAYLLFKWSIILYVSMRDGGTLTEYQAIWEGRRVREVRQNNAEWVIAFAVGAVIVGLKILITGEW